MKASTVEWVEKAEVDWEVAQRAYRARKVALYDAACFHCQQCIEKYLKARLNEAGVVINF
jgi:HEPN domain-containing protein